MLRSIVLGAFRASAIPDESSPTRKLSWACGLCRRAGGHLVVKSATWKAGCVKLGRAQLFGGRRVRRGPATIAAVTRRQSPASGGCRELRASAACSKTLPAQKPYFLACQNRREFAWRKVRLARLKNN